MTTSSPAVPRKRRWLSFGLRGAFVLLTIACVWLGIHVTRVRNQQQAVNSVQKLGGNLRFDGETGAKAAPPAASSYVPQWLRTALGEDHFRTVTTVDFAFGGGEKATDDDLAVFRTLDDVAALELGRNGAITDAGLEHLAGLKKLETLYLYRTNVTGPGLRHLPNNLQYLSLQRTPLGDEGLVHLRRLDQLKSLDLSNTAITDEGAAHLAAVLALEDLRLTNTDITDVALEPLQQLKNLKSLLLPGTGVTGEGVRRLQRALPTCRISPSADWLEAVPTDIELWPEDHRPTKAEIVAKVKELGGDARLDTTDPEQPITSLMIMDSTISEASLLRLLAEMPDLQQLNLRRVVVGDRLVAGLPSSRLSFLSLDDSRITDEGLRHVAQLATLRELSLNDTRVTDAGLVHLATLKSLRAVHLDGTRATVEGRANLRRSLPNCRISE